MDIKIRSGFMKVQSNNQMPVDWEKGELTIRFIFPSNFRIRSYADAQYFCKDVLQCDVDIPDADDPTLYHRFTKNGDTVMLGSAHCVKPGENIFTAEIPCCDDKDIIKRTFKIRKSINRLLQGKK